MSSIDILTKKTLHGTVKISGSKNASIPILCSTLLVKGKVLLKKLPYISDIENVLKILKYLGCRVKRKRNSVLIDTKNSKYKSLDIDMVKRIRGSYYFIPIFLNLYGKCEISLPGGCKIGERPIDEHIRIWQTLGYTIIQKDGYLKINKPKNEIKTITYSLCKHSVGASINAILSMINMDKAIIANLNIEPEGEALIDFLNIIGYNIKLHKNECEILHHNDIIDDIKYEIIPDRIEAMTFIIMGLLCGKVKIKGANYNHISYPIDLLIKNGYTIKINKKYIIAQKSKGLAFDIKTDIYPYFPTDMQPLFGVLFAYSRGACVVEEKIFDERMQIYYDLQNIGASINIVDNKAFIIGNSPDKVKCFKGYDLRHCAAIMLIILKNGGRLENYEMMQRGYEDFIYKISLLGAHAKYNL